MPTIRNLREEWLGQSPFKKDTAAEETQQKVSKLYGEDGEVDNPFLDKSGKLFNEYLNYQSILDSPLVAAKAKQFISDATGLTPTATSPSPAPATTPAVKSGNLFSGAATGNIIADTAQKYLGTPYVWGGESMSEGGMDCSGFVYNALKDAGYNIGRTTAQGYRGYGSPVSKDSMQPGDLIFFGKNGNASHIGIYLGNGQMIHSSGGSKNTKSNPGKGVTIANLNHRSDFLEARRY